MVLGALYRLVQTYRALHRDIDIEAIASKAGLHYSESDPFNSTRVQFDLFTKGDGRGVEHALWRDDDDHGRSFRAFDYWYYDEDPEGYGESRRTHHRFSCGMAYVGSSFPELIVEKESWSARR